MSSWQPFLINYTFGTNKYLCFSFCIIIYCFVYQYSILFATIDTATFRSSRPVLFCKKGDVTSFAKFRRNTKKEILTKIFSCEFCGIFHNIFFKEPFGRLLLHKHSLCLLSHSAQWPFAFSKTTSYIFSGSVFFRLN